MNKVLSIYIIGVVFFIAVIEVVVDRCPFEKQVFDCEYFQRWKFTEDLKSIVYRKNEMWSPIFEYVTPELELPHVKKGVYFVPNSTFNTKALVQFYPEVVNYFWRVDAIANDHNRKKAAVLKLEFSIHRFVERNRKRDRNGTKNRTN